MQNNKRYWLRGGLIIGGIYSVLFIVYVLYVLSVQSEQDGIWLSMIILALSGLPTTLLLEYLDLGKFLDDSMVNAVTVLFVFCTTQWFVIGSILGWIYGKIMDKIRYKITPQVR